MDVSKHLKTAIEYKEKGNVHFKAGEYMKAKKAYGHILLYVRGIPGSKRTKTGYEPVVGSQGAMLSETDDAAAFELERTAYQNLAITMLKVRTTPLSSALRFSIIHEHPLNKPYPNPNPDPDPDPEPREAGGAARSDGVLRQGHRAGPHCVEGQAAQGTGSVRHGRH